VSWKWTVAIVAVVLALLTWKAGSALRDGRDLANTSVNGFHLMLNGGQYEEICQEADGVFAGSGKHDEAVRFLEAVHTKLGAAGAEKLTNVRVNATTRGEIIVAQYNTVFEHGAAVETFTWLKSNGDLKLRGYYIQSNALVVN
jgi:hypothetical protein